MAAARKVRKSSVRGPNYIDLAFGEMVRSRRILAGISQVELGDALGLTFQQVQKYERGANRISVSRLFDLAAALDTTPSALLRDLEAELGMKPGPPVVDEEHAPIKREALLLMRHFLAIEEPKIPKRIRELARAVAPDVDTDEE